MKVIYKSAVLFSIGGSIYILIEFLWRMIMNKPPTHWAMFIVGGLAFLIIGEINERLDIPLLVQSFIGMVIIVLLEFISGCILNIGLGLHIWDYSNVPFNILGQICLPFAAVWFVLAMVAVVVDDYCRFIFFKEEMPRYQWWFSALSNERKENNYGKKRY